MFSELYKIVESAIAGNQFFAGMLGTSILAGLMYTLRETPRFVFDKIVTMITMKIVVRNSDPAFFTIEEWLSKRPRSRFSRTMSISTRSGSDDSEWIIGPGPGSHLVYHKRWPFLIDRRLNDKIGTAFNKEIPESFMITTICFTPTRLHDLINTIGEYKDKGDTLDIHVWVGWWRKAVSKQPRLASTLVLPGNTIGDIVADAKHFLASKDDYTRMGIPYHRGYMFSGPPGTGKTSLAAVLASELGYSICTLSLSSIKSDADLLEAFYSAPLRSIIVIDDIDAMGTNLDRGKETKAEGSDSDGTVPKGKVVESGKSVTLAGLLNALDGLVTADGRIVVIATNHPDDLDAALIRPGRVDIRVDFGPLGEDECILFARRFFPYAEASHVHLFSRSAMGMMPAEIQHSLMISNSVVKAAEYIAKQKNMKQQDRLLPA